jgi:AraC-like DNA-binding protein
MAASADPVLYFFDADIVEPKQDSIRKNSLVNALNTYKEKLKNNPSDSFEIFKNIGLIYAQLNNPKEAFNYTLMYIKNSSDISILNNDSFNQIIDTEEYYVLKNKYLPKGNILIFIYFYIVLIGFFFAILINFKKESDKVSSILIGGFVTVHSLFILEFAIYVSNIRYLYPHTYLISSSVALLYGPLLFFYFKRITQQYVLKPKDILHIIPALILCVILIPFYSLPAKEKLNIIFGISSLYKTQDFLFIVFIPKLTSYIIYGFLIGKIYFDKQNKLIHKNDDVLVKWKRNIYYIHMLYIFAYAFYGITISGILITNSEAIYHSQVLAMSLMVLYIAQMAYLNPKVFSYKSLMFKNGMRFSKYLKSGLTPSLSEELKGELIALFNVDKVYRDSNLNLDALSEKLNTTRHNTSQIINEHFDMNFFELINKFRIDEAINLLLEDKNGNLNIIDIAYEVGYNNKVTFNKAFKKSTSLTPTEFIDSIKNSSLVKR